MEYDKSKHAPIEVDTEHVVSNKHERPGHYRDYFAEKIDFYGMGMATRIGRSCLPSECADAPYLIAFRVSGDEFGICAVAFEEKPTTEDEASLLTELANILASKFVTQLADAWCADIMISPPQAVPETKDRLAQNFVRSVLRAPLPPLAVSSEYRFKPKAGADKIVRLAYLPSTSTGGNT